MKKSFLGELRRRFGPGLRQARKWLEALKYFDARVWQRGRGNNEIYGALISGKPQAIGKIGSGELHALRTYLKLRDCVHWPEPLGWHFPGLYTVAGVYPEEPRLFRRFADYMLQDVLPHITVLGVWFKPGEARIVNKYAPKAIRVPIRSLESYYCAEHRWTAALEGKKVLVMHPFVNSIRHQYERRSGIWPGREDILPAFNLVQIRVPPQPCLVKPEHADWFESLEDMKRKMSATDFDIALIGAGAYSLALAVHAKSLGRCGIHLGGSTQTYFGIKGRRWDNHPVISRFFNAQWIRPLPEDVPPGNESVEGGCYW
jgi:hypothetical protein